MLDGLRPNPEPDSWPERYTIPADVAADIYRIVQGDHRVY